MPTEAKLFRIKTGGEDLDIYDIMQRFRNDGSCEPVIVEALKLFALLPQFQSRQKSRSGSFRIDLLCRECQERIPTMGQLCQQCAAKPDVQLFRIKPLEWEDAGKDRYEACPLFNVRLVLRRRASNRGWEWRTINGTHFMHCTSPEEGKQLAEQHWQEYIKQALIPVETNE